MSAIPVLVDKLREVESRRADLALKIERDERDLQSNRDALTRLDTAIIEYCAAISVLEGYGR